MKIRLLIILFFASMLASAQKKEAEVLDRMKRFHQLLVEDRFYIDQYVDDSLSYGHSNGWVENKKEFYANLGEKIVYHSFKEDSMQVSVNKNMAHARFVADIDATLNGKRTVFHLKVLEVWVRSGKSWKLFARQAIK